eukprot:m.71830 g.71830  ORF g.71830 m.71830 type:complete len:759 (+) comp11716_c1_seq1:118-2394(+)
MLCLFVYVLLFAAIVFESNNTQCVGGNAQAQCTRPDFMQNSTYIQSHGLLFAKKREDDYTRSGSFDGWNPCQENGCFLGPETARVDTMTEQCLFIAEAEDHWQKTVLDHNSTVQQGHFHHHDSEAEVYHFTHIVNAFDYDPSDHQYQWTIDALLQAKAKAKLEGIMVEILAIIFQEDSSKVHFPDDINVAPVLCNWRNAHCITSRMRGSLNVKERPGYGALVSDMFQYGYFKGKGRHLVFTNYDIILRNDFYIEAYRQLQQPNVLSVDILRHDMMIPPNVDVSGWSVGDVFKWKKNSPHPGHDCFIFPRSWVPCLYTRTLMLGIAKWGNAFISMLRKVSKVFGGNMEVVQVMDFTRHFGKRQMTSKICQGCGKDWKIESYTSNQLNENAFSAMALQKIPYIRRTGPSSQPADPPPFSPLWRNNLHQELKKLEKMVEEDEKVTIPSRPIWNGLVTDALEVRLSNKCVHLQNRKFIMTQDGKDVPLILLQPGVDELRTARLLETLTGHYIGAVHNIPTQTIPHPGFKYCDETVIGVLARGETFNAKRFSSANFTGQCGGCSLLTRKRPFRRAIVFVGNMFSSVYNRFLQRATTGGHGFFFEVDSDSKRFDFSEHIDEIVEEIESFFKEVLIFLSLHGKDSVRFVDSDGKESMLNEVLDFLGLETKRDESRIKCAISLSHIPSKFEIYTRLMQLPSLQPSTHNSTTLTTTLRNVVWNNEEYANKVCKRLIHTDSGLYSMCQKDIFDCTSISTSVLSPTLCK